MVLGVLRKQVLSRDLAMNKRAMATFRQPIGGDQGMDQRIPGMRDLSENLHSILQLLRELLGNEIFSGRELGFAQMDDMNCTGDKQVDLCALVGQPF